jgi:hypothetical protein
VLRYWPKDSAYESQGTPGSFSACIHIVTPACALSAHCNLSLLQVLRYWPKDAGRNKGDPWFAAVVTDYEEDTGAHILTYQFGTQKEEKERVALALKQPSELRVSGAL